MTKHAKNSNHLQAVDSPTTIAVKVPLPLLGAFANIRSRSSNSASTQDSKSFQQ
jgi:hypothetical protein